MKSNARLNAKQSVRFAREQSGYALLLVVVGLVIGSLAYLTSNLNTNSVRHSRDEITRQALIQAKDALIFWSAMHQSGPGHLPCPSPDEKGVADTLTCGTVATRVGRLPWKTLGLPDIRDGNGDQLWYAVSRCFLERSSDKYCGKYAVNSDTEGQLDITQGGSPSKVIAIIFSPGPPTTKKGGVPQKRGLPGTADFNDVSNYLEGKNADGTAVPFEDTTNKKDNFEIRPVCEDACANPDKFNDQLLLIDSKDLFPIVEYEVAKRLGSQLGPMLIDYGIQWAEAKIVEKSFFPYAAPANPSQIEDNFCGAIPPPGQPSKGLLPVSEATACISWSGSVADSSGRVIDPTKQKCVNQVPKKDPPVQPEPDADRMAALVCEFYYSENPTSSTFEIKATVQHAAMTFALPIQMSDIKYGSYPSYGGTGVGASISQSFSGGDLSVDYLGVLPKTAGFARIVIPIYSLRTRYSLHDQTDWFFDNDWFRLTYYAVASPRLIDGSGHCDPGTDCLVVNGLPASDTNDDKEVVFVLAGHALSGQTRPSIKIGDYWEAENAEAGDPLSKITSFRIGRRTPTFNDRVSIISP